LTGAEVAAQLRRPAVLELLLGGKVAHS
jgi:hypothetical protein